MIVACGTEHNRNSFELSIPENRSLGIMLSSGADSAILLYLMCLELIQTGRSTEEIKYIFTVPKTDGAELHSANIVNWINEKLQINLPQPTIIGADNLTELHHSIQIRDSIKTIFNKYDPSGKDLFVYLADQRPVPRPWVYPFPSDTSNLEQPHRATENEYPEFIGLPFNHLDKSHTIDLHFIFDTQGLLELSHSCTQNLIGRCNECYHCFERMWAFDKLGKLDPGTN